MPIWRRRTWRRFSRSLASSGTPPQPRHLKGGRRVAGGAIVSFIAKHDRDTRIHRYENPFVNRHLLRLPVLIIQRVLHGAAGPDAAHLNCGFVLEDESKVGIPRPAASTIIDREFAIRLRGWTTDHHPLPMRSLPFRQFDSVRIARDTELVATVGGRG